MAELKSWKQARKELLADSETAKEYEELRPQYEVISQIIKARDEQGITYRASVWKIILLGTCLDRDV